MYKVGEIGWFCFLYVLVCPFCAILIMTSIFILEFKIYGTFTLPRQGVWHLFSHRRFGTRHEPQKIFETRHAIVA